METGEVLSHVDHTRLKPCSTWEEIACLCEEAAEYQTASVCIPPSYVERVKREYGEHLKICTVIGFPLGYHTQAAKVYEAEDAVKNGADEIDMVVNLGDVKNGDFDRVTEEIAAVKKAAGKRTVKVIVETCYLTESEKVRLCECVEAGGADFIKTSTGFGTGGAALEDICLFRKCLGPSVRIKASGGIRTKEKIIEFIEAGCDRIGTSSAVEALKNEWSVK